MKNGKMKRRIAALALILLLAVGQAGCSMLKSGIHDLHGSIFGNEYNIDIFDNMGIRTLKQLISCGDTCIFYDTRLSPEYEFYLDDIDSSSSGIMDSVLIAGKVNSIKNAFGKPMVVVIKSQMGAPIYAFSGNKVYWEVQEDLPKFTKLMIDGKALYIHRANFQIIDKGLLD